MGDRDAAALLTRQQVAELAGCSQATVRRAEGKELRTQREALVGSDGQERGSIVRIVRDDAEAWAATRRAQAPIAATPSPSASGPEHSAVPQRLDGVAMARVLTSFREGNGPIDTAIALQLELSTVRSVWRQYHEALEEETPGDRLDALSDAVTRLEEAARCTPRDGAGVPYERHLPLLFAQIMPDVISGLGDLRRRVRDLESYGRR